MNKPTTSVAWQRALVTLSSTVLAVVVVITLYWAQSIFVPLALAAFLTFLLSPFVTWFRQHGLGRTPSVLLVVLLAAIGLGSAGWLVTDQITSLIRELPKHSQEVKTKFNSARAAVEALNPLKNMLDEVSDQSRGVAKGEDASSEANTPKPNAKLDGMFDSKRPQAVVVEAQSPAWLSRISAFLSPLLEYLGQFALAIILVIFMLLKREELRNRVIRLVGQGHIVATTKFVDEAGQKVSRFLLMQAIVNSTFGVILAGGLLLIGVQYAILWGFLAAALRYLPYIGPYLAAVFPISLSLATLNGWGPAIMVLALFLTMELIVANFIEPRLYGHSMGVSEIALLVSAAFWAFLWGPVGLVLSSPLTVCLVVLGRYIPRLEWIAVLMGDEPALESGISFYQRLLARDQDEAEDLAIEHIKDAKSVDPIFDEMLVPALSAVKRNRLRGEITEGDEQFVLQAIREIVEDLSEFHLENYANDKNGASTSASATAPEKSPISAGPVPIFGCAAHDAEDRVALEMLATLLDPTKWQLQQIAGGTLTAELLELVADQKPSLVCIAAIPPGGLAHTRYLCKRLRSRFPEIKILVGRWGQGENLEESSNNDLQAATQPANERAAAAISAAKEASASPAINALREAGADLVATSLLETRNQLASLLPVLVQSLDQSATAARELDALSANQKGHSTPKSNKDREPAAAAALT